MKNINEFIAESYDDADEDFIGAILNRQENGEYNSQDFYYMARNSGDSDVRDIARKMDIAEEEDVQRAIVKYLSDKNYGDASLFDFIKSVNWIEA